MGDDARAEPVPRRRLAEKLNRLFEVVHPADRPPYSNNEVAEAIVQAGGEISGAYIWMLRKGTRDNPTMKHLDALARFFDVKPAYFFDDDQAEQIDRELDALAALRDSGVRKVALRAQGLSPQSLEILADAIEKIRDVEQRVPGTTA
ncbi:MAG: XRE family transcriptional regulator [Pseudonocardia sp.]|nr:XRE family transcriptional regulator [Pseudonocardia sp.]